jgi:hypothetical protein
MSEVLGTVQISSRSSLAREDQRPRLDAIVRSALSANHKNDLIGIADL